MVGSIDFSWRPDLYNALKNYISSDSKHKNFMIFHDYDNEKKDKNKNKEKKVWIVWWGADRSS